MLVQGAYIYNKSTNIYIGIIQVPEFTARNHDIVEKYRLSIRTGLNS